MESKNSLRWSPVKKYKEDGVNYKIVADIRLDDECHNGHCDFSITSMIYEVKRNGKVECVGGGCNHEEIVKHFPELERFIPLHFCGHAGEPMLPVENGIYHIEHSNPQLAKSYLRVTDREFILLSKYTDEKLYFKYLLFNLGIVSRWEREADEFIYFLEEKCGYKWANPYSAEEERFRLSITEEERKQVEKMVLNGEFTDIAIVARRKAELDAEIAKQVEEVESEYKKSLDKANAKRETLLYILSCGVTLKNVIYYDHSDKVSFNWKSYEKMISKEQFDKIVDGAKGAVPDFVTFELKAVKEK